MKKNKVLIVIICVLLLAAGAFGYWFFCLREAPAAPVDAGPVTEEPVDPDTSGEEGPVIAEGDGTDIDPNEVFEEVVGGEDAAGTPAELIKKYNITDPMQVADLLENGTLSPNEAYDLLMLFETGAATSSVDMSAAKAEADRINTQYDLDGDGNATTDELLEGGYFDDKPEEKAQILAQKEWAETTTWGGPTITENRFHEFVASDGRAVRDMTGDELDHWLDYEGGIEELRAAGLWD